MRVFTESLINTLQTILDGQVLDLEAMRGTIAALFQAYKRPVKQDLVDQDSDNKASEDLASYEGMKAEVKRLPDNVDLEILAIYLDEAKELQEQMDAQLDLWQQQPFNKQYPDELKRILHTLKGGARLAGLRSLGDLTHQFESWLEASYETRIRR